MRMIPKDSKIRLTFWKGFTIPDMVLGFAGLGLIAVIVATNFSWRFYLAIGLAMLLIPMFVKVNGERIYVHMWHIIRYLFSKKSYRNEGQVSTLVPYSNIMDKSILNKDGSVVSVLSIGKVGFDMLSKSRQDDLMDSTLGRILNSTDLDEEWALIKLDRPLILDRNLQDELERIDRLASQKRKSDSGKTLKEIDSRINVCEGRFDLIDGMNSDDSTIPCFYLALIGDSKKEVLNKIQRAQSIFDLNGMGAKVLEGKELKDFLRYANKETFDERLSSEERLLCPDKCSFGLTSAKYNGWQASQIVVNGYPNEVPNAWLERLFNLDGIKVVMRMKPVEKSKAIHRIDNAILEIETQQNRNKTSEVMEKDSHVESLEELMQSIQQENETLFDTTLIVSVYDKIGKNINRRKVKNVLREMGFSFSEMMARQEETYVATHLSKVNPTKMSHGIQTSSLSASFPFGGDVIDDTKGILIGETSEPAFIDFSKRDGTHINSNLVVIGQSGSGKSFATKSILANLASDDQRVFALDPENEYGNLARNLGGTSFDVSAIEGGKINPFEIILGMEDEEISNSYFIHLQFLEQFYKVVLPGISPDALETLNRLTSELYSDFGINPSSNLKLLNHSSYPTFDDLGKLVDEKLEKEEDEYIKSCLRIISNYIAKFRTGGRNSNIWNGPTSFSPKENFIAFNFQKMLANKNEVIANAQLLLILKWLENEVIKNRDLNIRNGTHKKIVIAIDEAHLFIDEKYPIALDFMYQLAKRIRKYDGMLIIVTQNVKDFTGTVEIARKSMAIINVSQYSMIFSLSPNDMSDLVKLYKNAGGINQKEIDSIIHAPRGTCFLVSSASQRAMLDISTPEETTSLF